MNKIAVEDLEVYKRTEQLLFRTYTPITNYPNCEKYRLSQKTINTFLEVLTYMFLGNDVKSKRREYLQIADGHLKMLKVCFRLARYRKYISKEFHRQISVELTEIKKSKKGRVKKVFKVKREVIEDAKKADFAGKGQREMEIAYA